MTAQAGSLRLSQDQIREITGCRQQTAQERRLGDLGYIVLGRNALNQVQALAVHPSDPGIQPAGGEPPVVLNLGGHNG